MEVNSISNNSVLWSKPQPQAKPGAVTTKKIDAVKPDNAERKYSKREVCAIALTAAVGAGYIFSAALHGRLIRSTQSLRVRNTDLAYTLRKISKDNDEIKSLNKSLSAELQSARAKLKDLIEGDISPKDLRENIYNNFKAKIDTGNLDYDITKPPVTGKGVVTYDDAIDLPGLNSSYKHPAVPEFYIPQLGADGSFHFKVPESNAMEVTHMPRKSFTPIEHGQTSITESYANSVRWDNDKVARDLLQNFFDGHGHTLDGVKLDFEPIGGKVKVRISGDSTYTVDKAIYLGETTKSNDPNAAGNFGEGLKMCALKLLTDGGASDVKIVSDNWNLTYNLEKAKLTDKRILTYRLDELSQPYNGNYVEFETNNKDLLEALRKSINRFYHSKNKDFISPDFDSDLFGIKILNPNEKGGVYIAGQRFEFNGDYDGLNGAVIYFPQKPPKEYLDVSRDRTSLNSSDLTLLGAWLSSTNGLQSLVDKVDLMTAMEKFWTYKPSGKQKPLDEFFTSYLHLLKCYDVHFKFPEKYIAYSDASADIVAELQRAGYVICKKEFKDFGMKTINQFYGDARAHEPLVPDDVQAKKIMILKEAINSLTPTLKDRHFSADEINTKIYLFDKSKDKESKIYEYTNAEAIIDKGTSKGFWIDKEYLNNASLSDVLETALHELSHKAGGDETAEFSYKLTNVNRDAIALILNDTSTRENIQALSRIWSELSV